MCQLELWVVPAQVRGSPEYSPVTDWLHNCNQLRVIGRTILTSVRLNEAWGTHCDHVTFCTGRTPSNDPKDQHLTYLSCRTNFHFYFGKLVRACVCCSEAAKVYEKVLPAWEFSEFKKIMVSVEICHHTHHSTHFLAAALVTGHCHLRRNQFSIAAGSESIWTVECWHFTEALPIDRMTLRY